MLLASVVAFYHRGEIALYLNAALEPNGFIARANKAGETLKSQVAAKIARAKQIVEGIDFTPPGSDHFLGPDTASDTGVIRNDFPDCEIKMEKDCETDETLKMSDIDRDRKLIQQTNFDHYPEPKTGPGVRMPGEDIPKEDAAEKHDEIVVRVDDLVRVYESFRKLTREIESELESMPHSDKNQGRKGAIR